MGSVAEGGSSFHMAINNDFGSDLVRDRCRAHLESKKGSVLAVFPGIWLCVFGFHEPLYTEESDTQSALLFHIGPAG